MSASVNRLTWRFAACAALAFALVGPSRADNDAAIPEVFRASEPSAVSFSGDKVTTWDQAGTRMVLIEGRAAVFRGTDGLRADRIVARLSRRSDTHFDLELAALGRVQRTERPHERLPELRVNASVGGSPAVRANRADQLFQAAPDPSTLAAIERVLPSPPSAEPAPAAPDPASEPTPTPDPLTTGASASPEPAAEPEAPDADLPPVDMAVAVASAAVAVDAQVPNPDAPAPIPSAPPDLRRSPPLPSPATPPVPDDLPDLPPDAAPVPDPAATQFREEGFDEPTPGAPGAQEPGPIPLPDAIPGEIPSSDLPPIIIEDGPAAIAPLPAAPIAPESIRRVEVFARDGRNLRIRTMGTAADGTSTAVVTGGVTIVVDDPRVGTIDISADQAILWSKGSIARGGDGAGGQSFSQSPDDPLEVYLEGEVVFLQDRRRFEGSADRQNYKARRFYADIRNERFLALDGELEAFAPGMISPLRAMATRIFQYRPWVTDGSGRVLLEPNSNNPQLGSSRIIANQVTTTGSSFANPGYRFNSRTLNLTELTPPTPRNPATGERSDPPDSQQPETLYEIDSRTNVFYMGRVPIFFWPRFVTTTEDLDPPLRQISFRTNNLFGQQVLTDWSGFKLLGLRRPRQIDNWNIDLDYLSDRGFAAGSELGYSGTDISKDLTGVDRFPNWSGSYFGYFDIWGLPHENGIDNLGQGPAVVTNGPPGAGRRGYQRDAVPPFQDVRGRLLFRHMQSLLEANEDPRDDFRIQVEAGYYTDRYFLEQYFKRLNDSGLDQQTLVYGIRNWRNQAVTAMAEANLQEWYTDSQWLPKLDYYALGGAPFKLDRYFQNFFHAGASYANTHTAIEVDRADLFAFLPYDPVSLTSGPFTTGRLFVADELNVPINLQFLRVVPYAQGQLVGWSDQYDSARPTFNYDPLIPVQNYIRGPNDTALGRFWGAAGVRADIMAHRIYPSVESELLNLHGLAHKATLYADYRYAQSSQSLNRIGVQDDLDDNTYEFVRRYFALINYRNGLLPPQYNPLLLTNRRYASPITGAVDALDTMETLRFGLNQRLQTKRGPEGLRRVVDIMSLDVGATYFPQPSRDNFGKNFGQLNYNYAWFLGDRTSIVSSGWFDFFDIGGSQLANSIDRGDTPFGLTVISTGISINRPPRGNVYLGYSIIDSGPVRTSALNGALSYLLSPKWFTTLGTSYDFGNNISLGTTWSVTRIGADYLTSIGLSFNPLQNNYSFGFEITPRLSPNIRVGSSVGNARPDTRYAPTQ